MLVVVTMFARPKEYRILKCSCPKNNSEKPHYPVSLESQMREKSVISKRDGKSTCPQHDEEKRDLKPVDAKKPEVDGYDSDRQNQGSDQELANEPIDSVEWNMWKHSAGWLFGGHVSRSAQSMILSRSS